MEVDVLVGTGVIGETVRGLDVALGSGVVTGISKKFEVGDGGICVGAGLDSPLQAVSSAKTSTAKIHLRFINSTIPVRNAKFAGGCNRHSDSQPACAP